MTITYTFLNSSVGSNLSIAFLLTGESVPSSDLDKANTIFAEVFDTFRLVILDPTFDFWRFINWMFVSYYWGALQFRTDRSHYLFCNACFSQSRV